MRPHFGIFAALLFASALFGQNRFGTPVVTGGFGNAVFPAGTPANNPAIRRFTSNAVFPGGGGPHLTIPGKAPARYTGSRGIAVPYAFPVYVGEGYDGAYASPAVPQQPQNVTVVYPPQAAPVIVNQYGQPGDAQAAMDAGNPDVGAYQPEQPDEPADRHFLIGLKDHTVYSVANYWVSGDTLHYFTAGNVHNQVSLSLVDRALTTRLNRESGAEVKLPDEKAPADK